MYQQHEQEFIMKSKHSHYLTLASLVSLSAGLSLSACKGEDAVEDGMGGDASGGMGGKSSGGGGRSSGGSSTNAGGASLAGGGQGGDPTSSGGLGGEPTSSGGAPTEPAVYGVVTQVFGTDAGDTFSYLVPTDGSGGELDLDEGTEILGRALGVGIPGSGSIYVGVDSGPTVTRYDLNSEGQFEAGPSVSFFPAGVTGIGEYAGQFHFVSEEKAYFFDGSTAQLIVWNPKEMTYEKKVSLASLVHPDELLTFGAVPIVSGDKVMMFPGWRSSDNLVVPSRAAVVTVDTTDDSVEIDVLEDRCGYTRDGVLADDGFVYLATEAYGAAVYELNDANADAPCLLRFDVESGEFDESFQVDIPSLFDGDSGGSLLVDGQGRPYLLRLDASLYAGPPAGRPMASSKSWLLARLNPGDDPTVEMVEGTPALPGSILVQYFDGGAIAPIFAGQTSTELFQFSDGLGDSLASVDGLAFSVVKVR